MKELFKTWNFKKHLVLTIALTVIVKVVSLLTYGEAASIGIIGGADGPTSVFVAGNVGSFVFQNIIPIIVFVFMLVIYIPIKFIRSRYSEK